MTVKELISILKPLPQAAQVYMESDYTWLDGISIVSGKDEGVAREPITSVDHDILEVILRNASLD